MDTGLIIKYLEGNLSREYEKELFGWLSASEENMKLFREMEAEWKAKHIPSVEALQTLHSIRDAIKSRDNNRRKHLRRWIYASAAAAAVVAGIFIFGITGSDEDSQKELQVFAIEAPMGTHSKISLPDGTRVWLNAGSVLSYDSGFNKTARDIRLNGEAYFEVAHNKEKPFKVLANGCSFVVLGTKFNINAYDDDPVVQTVLIEGSLRFETPLSKDVMIPGDMISWNPSEGTYNKEKVNAGQYRSWISGNIVYDSITLPALLKRLSREYGVRICLDTDRFNGKSIRVSYADGESVDSILSALCRILPIEVTQRDGEYHVGVR